MQPDGEIVAAGYADNNFALLRYTSEGALDTTFGLKGKDTTGFGLLIAIANAVVIQPDSEIVVAGSVGSAFALARYKINGSLDSTFGMSVKVTTSFSGVDDEAYAVALQPDGKIIAAGYTEDDTVYYFAVARYAPALLLGVVDVGAPVNSIIIYPNPVQDVATLDYKLINDETVTINLYDITGRLVQTITTNETVNAGEHQQAIDLKNLTPGCYFIAFSNSHSQNRNIKVIKE